MRALSVLARIIDALNETVGRWVSWVALLMVVVQFVLVLMRYVFGVGSIFVQESVVYMHALLFMAAAGYTLLHDAHVRVDIFYREARRRRRALINAVGVVFLLVPVCGAIWWTSWPYVAASWAVHEGSMETSGIQAVFLLKTLIPVFALLLALQGLSLGVRAVLVLVGIAPPGETDGGNDS